jgi:hypothetical protein
MQTTNKHTFKTTILRSSDWLSMHFVQVPLDLAKHFVELGVKRVLGEVNGAPFRLALISDVEGGKKLVIGSHLLKAAKAFEGGQVSITIWPDPDPDRIDLPDEFAIMLEQDEEVAAKFYALKPRKQEELAYCIGSAKHVDTRIKRAVELVHKLKHNTLYAKKISNTK